MIWSGVSVDVLCSFFFFQAEDGIRDVERSRGLGMCIETALNHPYPFDLGVIWSDPPRRMICLEPWTSPRNSFVDGFRNIMIPSNDSKRLYASIQIKSLK